MSFINRFSKITNGALTITGNTLGLDKRESENNPGNVGSIGAFITLDKESKVNLFPYGTTLDYKKNSSSAILNIPPNSNVLYAELIWGGNYNSPYVNLTPFLNDPITLTTPDGTSYEIHPDKETGHTAADQGMSFYMRSCDVTSIIKKIRRGNIYLRLCSRISSTSRYIYKIYQSFRLDFNCSL